MIRAKAPGKMILLGEYAVLEGAPALVSAVDRHAEVEATENQRSEFSVSAPSLDVEAIDFVVTSKGHVRFDPRIDSGILQRLEFFRLIFEHILNHFENRSLPYLKFKLNTDAFYSAEINRKMGFGSSAALTAALIRVLLEKDDRDVSKEKVMQIALDAHHHAQGKVGSGIDIAASTYGGVLVYRITGGESALQYEVNNLDLWDTLSILPIWTGQSASTKKMVGGIREFKEAQPIIYDNVIQHLSRLSADGCAAFKQQDPDKFFEIVGDYHDGMDQLGQKSGVPVISPEHRRLNDIVRQSGGIYKPSGAGGGDIGIAFSTNADQLNHIKQKVEREGFKTLNIKIAGQGVQIV